MPLPSMDEIRRADAYLKAGVSKAYTDHERVFAVFLSVAIAAFLAWCFA